MKKRLRIIFYPLLAILICLSVGGYYFLQTREAALLAIDFLSARLSTVVEAELSYREAKGDLLKGLTLSDVKVEGQGRTWIRVPEIFIKFDPLPLLFGLFYLREVRIKDPAVSVRQRADYDYEIPILKKNGVGLEKSGLKVLGRLDRYRIENGTVISLSGLQNADQETLLANITLEGESGFSSFPGFRMWSAWCEIKDGAFTLVPQNRPVSIKGGKLVFGPDRFEVVDLKMETNESAIAIGVLYPWDTSKDYKITWLAPQIALHEWGFPEPIVIGTSGVLESQGAIPSLATADSDSRDIRTGVYRLKQIISWGHNSFEINGNLLVDNEDSSFRGDIGFNALDLQDMLGRVKNLSTYPMLASYASDWSDFAGRYKDSNYLTGKLTVKLDHLTGIDGLHEGTLTLSGGHILGFDIEQARIPFRKDGRDLIINQARFATSSGLFLFSASQRCQENVASYICDWDIDTNFTEVNANRLFSVITLPEKLNGNGQFQHHGGKLLGTVNLFDFIYKDINFSGLQSKFVKEKGGITFESLDVFKDEYVFHVQGGIMNNELNLHFSTDELPVQLFLDGYAGAIDVKGELKGTLEEPNFMGAVTIRQLAGFWLTAGEIKGNVQVGNVFTEPTTLWQWYGKDMTMPGDVVWTEATLKATEEKGGGVRISELQLQSAGRQWLLVEPVQFNVTADSIWVENLKLQGGEGLIELSLKKQGDELVVAKLVIKNMPVDLSRYANLPGVESGLLFIDLNLSGRYDNPAGDMNIRFDIKNGNYIKGFKGTATYSEKIVRFSGVLDSDFLQAVNENVRFEGNVPLEISWAPPRFSMNMKSIRGRLTLANINLEKISWPGEPKIHGVAAADIVVTPSPGDFPYMNGRLTIEDADYILPLLDTKLTGLSSQLALRDNRLIFQELQLVTPEGKIDISGDIELPTDGGFGKLNISLATKHIPLSYKGIHKAVIAGDIKVAGSVSHPQINGELTVLEAKFHSPPFSKGFSTTKDVVVYESRDTIAGRHAGSGIFPDFHAELKDIGLDIDILFPDNAWLQSTDLILEMRGRLHAKNNEDGFILVGYLTSIGGQCTVAGRNFRVTEGIVDFVGDKEINPKINATAECKMPGGTISALVEGTINEPIIKLTSDPWMPEENIKAAIMFGKLSPDGSDSNTGKHQSDVASVVGGEILSRVKTISGNQDLLESFNFYSGNGGKSDEGSISIGKYLSDDFLLSYEYMFDDSRSGQMHMEYKLKGGFSIESLLLDSEKSGLDIYWKRDF